MAPAMRAAFLVGCMGFSFSEFQLAVFLRLHGPNGELRSLAPSIVQRSRRTPGATGSAIPPRSCQGQDCKVTDSSRAAVIERSANPNRQTPSAGPEFEAGRST